MKKFMLDYTKFTLRSKLIYYTTHISESFLIGLFISFIGNFDTIDAIILIGIGIIFTPLGIMYVGGFEKIKSAFAKRHNFSSEDFL